MQPDNTKFAFIEPIVRIPGWHLLAATSVGLAALLLGFFYINSRSLAARGRSFLAVIVYATATAAVWIVYEYSQQYVTVTSVLVGSLLMIGMLGVIAVLLAEAHEWAEAHWATSRPRLLTPTRDRHATHKVSIHVPAHNEPPEMLIETLDALAALDYPDFEVLVVDNNTHDEAVWRPVQEHCREARQPVSFLPRQSAGGLQGRCAQSRAARDRAGRRHRRGHRQRLRGREGLAEGSGAGYSTNPRTGDRAGPAGLSRCERQRLQSDVLRRISRLLPTSAWSRATSATRSSSTAR